MSVLLSYISTFVWQEYFSLTSVLFSDIWTSVWHLYLCLTFALLLGISISVWWWYCCLTFVLLSYIWTFVWHLNFYLTFEFLSDYLSSEKNLYLFDICTLKQCFYLKLLLAASIVNLSDWWFGHCCLQAQQFEWRIRHFLENRSAKTIQREWRDYHQRELVGLSLLLAMPPPFCRHPVPPR